MNNHVIDVALGNAPADMVIKNGQLINVNTHEIYNTDIAIADGVIAALGSLGEKTIGADTQVIDAEGKYLAPGFIDAHIHFESSMLSYTEFSRMLVKHGTTAVATDLMEVAIVSGEEGINAIFEESEGLPVKLLYPVPAFMSEEGDLQTIGAALSPEMIERFIQIPRAVGLAEVLYPPILNKSPLSAHILELAEKFGNVLSVYRSTDYFIEIVPKGIDKAASIKVLIDKLNIPHENTIACGDGFNDLSMIKYAAVGVAMENAVDAVKENADYITASNNDDGIAKVVEKFIMD